MFRFYLFHVFDLFINCVLLILYISMYFYISLLVVRFLTSCCVYVSNCFMVAILSKRIIIFLLYLAIQLPAVTTLYVY